jgi:tRNA(adenine34) deaminase
MPPARKKPARPARRKAEKPDFMGAALGLARRAAAKGEVPVGAVVVDGRTGEILGRGHNLTRARHDPTAHAEMQAIRAAARKAGAARLEHCDLYVTLEPCPMCAQAISFARLRRLYYGAADPKGGAVDSGPRIFAQATCFHAPEVIGALRESECGELLKDFFRARR